MKYVKVKELFTIIKGKKVQQIEDKLPEAIRLIQIDDLRNDNNIKYCIKEENSVIATPQDIIIAWDGANAGTIGYGLEGVIGSTLAILRTKENNIFIPYIGKYLQSKSKYLRDTCTGATIPHISKKVLEELKIPLPSLKDQKQISYVLDKAQELIDKRKTQIEALDQLTQSVFLEMFGDPVSNPYNFPVKKIKDLVPSSDSIKSGPFGSALKKEYYVSKGYKVYGQEQVIRGDFSYGDYYIDEERYKKLQSYKIQSGDVLISLVGTFGKISIVPEEFEPGIINPRLMKVTLNQELIKPLYFKFVFSTPSIINQMLHYSHGGTMGILNTSILKEFSIPVPPIEKQNEFIEKVKKIEAQKELLQKSLTELENNFQSLMQRAFRGELFDDDPTHELEREIRGDILVV